ncbi:MAG: PBP1A family penicillin-binding protein [Alphaproteobacteria bacterium]
MARNSDKKRAADRKGPTPPRRPRWLRWLRASLILAIWGAVALGGLVVWYGWDLPDPEKLATPTRRPSVTLLADDGSVLATYGDLHGGMVRFNQIPPYLVQAVIATEDRRFFDHPGMDAIGILRAAFANLRAGAVRQGGSTLTQQIAKNLFLTPERSIRRKVREILLAFWLEARFDKRQLFTIYINRVYFGAGAWGLRAAARRYFGRAAERLGLRQAALLAGLLKAPSRYSPLANPAKAAARADLVIANMVAAGFLTDAQARAAKRERLAVVSKGRGNGARYFADWLLDRAAGYIGPTGRDLVIRTTLSPRLQRIAEKRIAAGLKGEGARRRVGQAALVAMAPGGAVRAMVGGRDWRKSQFNRATQALRQPGSAFKLFVYLAALEAGMTPADTVLDAPLSIRGWRPRNYTGRYRGRVTLADALAGSINTTAVRITEKIGRGKVVAVAQRLGITAPLKTHPSLALGASEVTLLELTGAYAALANRGYAAWPYGIAEIRDGTGSVLYRRAGAGAGRVIDPGALGPLQTMLTGVIARGTGRAARIGRPAAGKTGTSQESRDAWFIGFTAELVTGVWVGNDDSSPMKRVTGGGLPARLWRGFMKDALKGTPHRPLNGG